MRSPLSTFDEVRQQQFKQRLKQFIEQQFSQDAVLYLGCSGGMDSMLLLHLLAELIPQRLHVLSVDHQLQQASAIWSNMVASTCQHYGVRCDVLPVSVDAGNVEAAARHARYQAFEQYLEQDDVLILAHHQQDQAETVMLRLLQGAGVGGLSAMQLVENRKNKLSAHVYALWRPFLDLPKQQIEAWAQQQNLGYVDDPMNHDEAYDRVWCRDQLWPMLRQRFPKMQEAITRAADLMQDADAILAEVLQQDLAACTEAEGHLNLLELSNLSLPRQRQLLSRWMQGSEIYRPPLAMVQRLQQEVIFARQDASSVLHYAGYYYCRSGQILYRYSADAWQAFQHPSKIKTLRVEEGQRYALPSIGDFKVQSAEWGLDPALLGQQLSLQTRQGGEKIQLQGKSVHRPLKKLIQDAKIAPWQRHQIQILMYHTTVLGVFTPQGFWLAHSPFCQQKGWGFHLDKLDVTDKG